MKINFPFPVKLRFPSNSEKCMSKCCSQIWCKKYYGLFCYHEIIMSIIYSRLCRQTLIDRQSRHNSAQIDCCRNVRIYTGVDKRRTDKKRTADGGPRTADGGPRTADRGRRTADDGRGPRTADGGAFYIQMDRWMNRLLTQLLQSYD